MVTMGIIIPQGTPFITEFFQRIVKLDYPKQKIDLYIYSKVRFLFNPRNVSPPPPPVE
jgi:hypothetical protein